MKDKKGPRKPVGWLYALAVFLLGVYMRLRYGLKVDRTAIKGQEGPFLVVSNHQCNLDFISGALAVWPTRMNFVVTTYFFRSRFLRMLLGWMGAIPKKQFIPDISMIRDAYRAVGNKQSIYIFPEGQVGYAGTEVGIDDAIGKLAKRLKIPVVAVKLRGGHLTYPKWGRGRQYPARLEAKSEILLTAEQIAAMDDGEIFESIKNAIAYNEFDWQRAVMKPTRKERQAEGLQNVLYTCPRCSEQFVMKASGNELHCSACGYAASLDRYGFFQKAKSGDDVIFADTAAWFDMQKENIRREVADGKLPFVTKCRLHGSRADAFGYFLRGEGALSLDRDGFCFDGVRDGEPYRHFFSVDTQNAVTHNTRIWGFDFIGEDCNYLFEPDDSRKVLKLVELYAEIRRLRDLELLAEKEGR